MWPLWSEITNYYIAIYGFSLCLGFNGAERIITHFGPAVTIGLFTGELKKNIPD